MTVKYRDDQPRVPAGTSEGGQWTSGGGEPVNVRTVNEAIQLLGEGHGIEFERPEQAVTMLHKIRKLVKEAKADGEQAKVYDLCKVYVAGSNLFCRDTMDIPRHEMPQLKGVPVPGSPAARTELDAKGKADLKDAYINHLLGKGIAVDRVQVRADRIRGSQREIDGAKVAKILRQYEKEGIGNRSFLVSTDHYIVDGHHHWAAQIALAIERGEPVMMHVDRVHEKILPLLKRTKEYSKKMGIPERRIDQKGYDPDQPRDPAGTSTGGQWTSDGGVSGDSAAGGAFRPLPHDDWKRLPADPGYLYHATTVENLHNITADGALVPHGPGYGTDQESWPDGSTQKRSYYASSPAVAWSFAPDHGTPALLRVAQSIGGFRRESTGDYYTTQPIPAEHFQAVDADKAWRPVQKPEKTVLLLREVMARGLWPELEARLKYNPDQPRDPAGSPTGGQWTSGGTGGGFAPAPAPWKAALVADARQRVKSGSYTDIHMAFGHRLPRAADAETQALYDLAYHVEQQAGREAMYQVLQSGLEWNTNYAENPLEWAGAVASGAEANVPKGMVLPTLTAAQRQAFAARTAWVQQYVAREHGDQVDVYRGVKGRQATQLRAQIEQYWTAERLAATPNRTSVFPVPAKLGVRALSSTTDDSYLAGDFAGANGVVMKLSVPVSDVYWTNDLMNAARVIRYSDDRGELVVLGRTKERDAQIVNWGHKPTRRGGVGLW